MMIRFDLDAYREILDTITRNKSRSLLTGFGVFWGVFMLIFLLGGGNGFREMLQRNFAGFATNMAIVWPQTTTKSYKGLRRGRNFSMNMRDMDRLRRQVPELDVITPVMQGGTKKAVAGEYDFSASMLGTGPDYARVTGATMAYGRFINEFDIRQGRKVCVIGRQVYTRLFPKGGDPCGQYIRIDSIYLKVVGVDGRTGDGVDIGGRSDEQVTTPYTVFARLYNTGTEVHSIAVTGRRGVVMSQLSARIRGVIARAHHVDPTDEKAVMVFNTEVLFGILDNLFNGVDFLIWLVGIGTLLAGSIGVSNIMMVTVKERTSEIGIRRAIGATPRMILLQVMSESILLTAVAGMGGILLGVCLLQLLEMGFTQDGVMTVHFQVDFWTAIAATALLCVLGGLAGLAPAWRAMHVRPVEAIAGDN